MKFWPYVFLTFYKVYMVLKQSVVFPDEFDHEKLIFHCLKLENLPTHTRILKRLYDVTGRTDEVQKVISNMASDQEGRDLVVAEEENIV